MPSDEELLARNPIMEFEHGFYCAVSQKYGCKYWWENEAILRKVFDRYTSTYAMTHYLECAILLADQSICVQPRKGADARN